MGIEPVTHPALELVVVKFVVKREAAQLRLAEEGQIIVLLPAQEKHVPSAKLRQQRVIFHRLTRAYRSLPAVIQHPPSTRVP